MGLRGRDPRWIPALGCATSWPIGSRWRRMIGAPSWRATAMVTITVLAGLPELVQVAIRRRFWRPPRAILETNRSCHW